MTTVSNSDIIKAAKKIKEFVEKKEKLPLSVTVNDKEYSYPKCAYLFSQFINNPTKDIKLVTVKKADNPNGQDIKEDVYSSDYRDMAKRVAKFIEDNGKLPNFCTTVKSKTKVRTKLYIYGFAKIVVFYSNKKALPNYCTFDSKDFKQTKKVSATNNCQNPYKNIGHAQNKGCNGIGQNTPVYCAPHSMQEVIRKLTGRIVPQQTLASWAGTGSSGTGHDGIRTAIAKFNKTYGYNLAIEEKSFNDLGWTKVAKLICQPNIDIIWHVKYRNKWGHYEVVNEINTNTKRIKVQNSLGNKCTTTCYCGYVEDRSFADMESYMNLISQASLIIITKK